MQLSIVHPRVLATQDFTPHAARQGIPGSEETLLNVCKEFIRQGINVTVFTQTNIAQKYGELLNWLPMESMHSNQWFDCLCLWSDSPSNMQKWHSSLPNSANICVRLVNQSNKEDLEKVLNKGRRVGISQTDWFIAHNPILGKYPLFRWNNGINPSRFSHVTPATKVKGKIFYGSDYDRGLIHILNHWRYLKNKYPHITLSVCYGWDIFEQKYANSSNDAKNQMIQFKKHIELLFQQDGIMHLGRIGHRQVDEELISSEFWFYPCTFPENCSTLSLKAQAAKCIPVIIPTAGLQETVKYGLITSQGLWNRGIGNQAILPLILDEWATLAEEGLDKGYSAYQDILDANWRRTMKNYSYPQITSSFINRFF